MGPLTDTSAGSSAAAALAFEGDFLGAMKILLLLIISQLPLLIYINEFPINITGSWILLLLLTYSVLIHRSERA